MKQPKSTTIQDILVSLRESAHKLATCSEIDATGAPGAVSPDDIRRVGQTLLALLDALDIVPIH